MIEPMLTPDERRALGIAALTAGVSALVSGLVSWGIETMKQRIAKRRGGAAEAREEPCP